LLVLFVMLTGHLMKRAKFLVFVPIALNTVSILVMLDRVKKKYIKQIFFSFFEYILSIILLTFCA